MGQEPEKLDFTCTSDQLRVAVQGCGVKVEISAEGKVSVYLNSETRDFAPNAATAASAEALTIGARMPDGSIYAGVSPDTGKAMYATPKDAPLTYTFNQAGAYASKLDAHGHRDWRVPTKAELNVLFESRAAIGNFDTSGSHPAGWYWSTSQHFYFLACAQRFSDGHRYGYTKLNASSLRCVRG